ncbi:hypothetical protein [Pseudoalteromonas obscura]|uniref:Uncharacterized protein n=1 Tax=Pseudoalteromonas obscura TaxID=3048491 RepID=A0ABT7EHP1_9GAMM|nr:hypothetical protein [Pseudoalteromonas sp. P94(2023)]MDK2594565.1 hypothetical protein [Pseudoalteromonas sp. P94(2023)]
MKVTIYVQFNDNICLGRVAHIETVTYHRIVNFNSAFIHNDFIHGLNVEVRSGCTGEAVDVGLYVNTIGDRTGTLNGRVIQKHAPVLQPPPLSLNQVISHKIGCEPCYADMYTRSCYSQADYTPKFQRLGSDWVKACYLFTRTY